MKFGKRNFRTKHNLVCFPLLVWTWGPTCRPYLVADSDWPAGNTPSGSSICDWLLLDFSWGHGMASRHVGGTLVGPVEEGHSMKRRSLYRSVERDAVSVWMMIFELWLEYPPNG